MSQDILATAPFIKNASTAVPGIQIITVIGNGDVSLWPWNLIKRPSGKSVLNYCLSVSPRYDLVSGASERGFPCHTPIYWALIASPFCCRYVLWATTASDFSFFLRSICFSPKKVGFLGGCWNKYSWRLIGDSYTVIRPKLAASSHIQKSTALQISGLDLWPAGFLLLGMFKL
jgi:hypothetical protein